MGTVITNKFKVGDVVKLKSDGPLLTVTDTDGNLTEVTWFTEDFSIRLAAIHQEALVKV